MQNGSLFFHHLLLRGGLRSHSGTWRQHKKEPDCRAAPTTSWSSDERLQRRDSLTSGSRESSSQRRETLAASGSRRGSRESSLGRRDSERTVPSDGGPPVASGQDNDQEERGDQASVRRERSNSSLRKGSPREESARKASPREESLRRASPREQESLPPVASSGRVSRSIENVLSR